MSDAPHRDPSSPAAPAFPKGSAETPADENVDGGVNDPAPVIDTGPTVGVPRRRRMPRLITVLLCCTAALLVCFLAWTLVQTRSLDFQIVSLRDHLLELRREERLRKERYEKYSLDREMLLKVLRQCRVAEDIPPWDGNLIVARLIDSELILFHLPEGKHTLQIRCRWEPGKVSPGKTLEGNSPLQGQQTWERSLDGGGYAWHFRRESRGESLASWELTGNREGFETQRESLPLPPLRLSGASWSSFEFVGFPNEVSIRDVIRNQIPADPQPLLLGRMSKSGRLGKDAITVRFEVSLVSETPAVMTAAAAASLTEMNRAECLGDYLGEGLYAVKPTASKPKEE